ncbi:MAG TPA: hypothetical protein VN181_11665, partial [Thermoanaerobaculia bacterium]|nr:hypothetical protein [Thermoanaerobaculia bacterium]
MSGRSQVSDAVVLGIGVTVGGQHVPLEEIYVTKEMPTYVSHKRVQAAEILAVAPISHDGKVRVIVNGYPDVFVPDTAVIRYKPQPGDFLVIYEDGYQSFSPRKAFLDGYALAHGENVLMERLNDLAMSGPGVAPMWLQV